MTREAFRGVVWPRDPVEIDGKRVYRYAIVGVLVSSEPLPGYSGGQEIINGEAMFAGLGEALARFEHEPTDAPLGDATEVLVSLGDLPAIVDRQRPGG